MQSKLLEAIGAFSGIYSGWILWNLFLAFIPLALSFWLFRRQTNDRTTLWWLGWVVFIAFLPNAPYLLTDIIHLIRGIRAGYAIWIIALVFIPLHIAAIIGGFEAYVISLINQGHYLKRQGQRRFVVWSELAVHAVCAVGIYLGRFRRLNSWDLVTDPGNVLVITIDDLTAKLPLVVIFITFAILTVFYWVMKQITLGLLLRFRYARQHKPIESDFD
ncbi:DUF1361 domain-containing protein [Stenomitos frigidus]|uniref:DUF1361 domain-containing protein n=1 Tax=Stenomitos frigidus ULC18 TaxID=2107698 RepID=A0A2T1DV45_9CYAN|nr:DUF1361 domain-containing protein [Stenomitos frigidus]PSB24386.1 DUF1361 domain-containing protein [Stenomitos frigidus ULC18]